PRVEFEDLPLQDAAEQVGGFIAAPCQCFEGGERLPADLLGVLDHRELDAPGLADLERAHATASSDSASKHSSADRSSSSTRSSPVISLCSRALNSSSSTTRFLRCDSILRSMATRTATISRCSSSVGGNGIGNESMVPVFKLYLPSAAGVALPATREVPSSDP